MPQKIARRTASTLFLFACVSSGFSATAFAEQTATGDDGRQILLKDNGTWEYQNTDRYGTTESGSRVRLKDDKSWEFMQNKEVVTPKIYSEKSLNVTLADVVILTQKTPIPNTNNYRIKSETQFTLNVAISAASKNPIAFNLHDLNLFSVTDNRGEQYPTISVTPQQQQLLPGKSYTFTLLVDGGPKHSIASFGGRIKQLILNIDKSAFNTNADIELHRDVNNLKEQVEKK